MSSGGYWASEAEPIIRAVLEQTRGQDEAAIKKALREAYPWPPRSMWPYRDWCAEVRRQRGLLKQKPAEVDKRQLGLFEEG